MVMNNKGTNVYTIRNFRRVKKNAYTRIACVHFASALFAYLRAALYVHNHTESSHKLHLYTTDDVKILNSIQGLCLIFHCEICHSHVVPGVCKHSIFFLRPIGPFVLHSVCPKKNDRASQDAVTHSGYIFGLKWRGQT